LVKGIGPILAKKLVGRFGAEVLAVIANRAAELQSVDGIGPKRRERITHAWQEAKQVREIMLFLYSRGVSTSRAVRIFKTYGEQAIEKVQSNPYTLAKDIYGIGFATADQIAQKVGIPRDSLNRARAGIDHVLLEATSDGHCALPLEKLKLAAVKLLEVPEGTVEQALSQMLTSGSLLLEEIDGDALIFLPHLRRAEEGIAAKIKSPNAHRIRRGQMPDMRGADPSSDFHFVERDDPEKIAATLVKLVQERIPERFRLDPIRDVQVLCPMNRGSLGVRELNTALQRVLNPARPGQPAVERFGWRFQMGDKVIQTENDYDKDVFNGDVGIVERIDMVEQ
jgi:exodeoxyribonuclease V alpha subunit